MCLPTKKINVSMDNNVLLNGITGQPNNLPSPPLPLLPLIQRCILYVIFYTIVPFLFPMILLKLVKKISWMELWNLFQLVWKAGQDPISDHIEYYQNPKLLQQLYKEQKSAKVYVEHNAFEWQHMEGYCGPTTLRCVLTSFGISKELLPPQLRGPTNPEKFIQLLEDAMMTLPSSLPSSSSSTNEEKKTRPCTTTAKELTTTTTTTPHSSTSTSTGSTSTSNNNNNNNTDKYHSLSKITSEIIPGDCSYELFLETIRRIVENENEVRIVINYLRPALFGPPGRPMMWFPTHILFGLLSGHFSPIIGIIEREEENDTMNPLVAVFDVNHKYGGTYFVPARQLYQSIQAKDTESGNSRALIVLTKNNKTD